MNLSWLHWFGILGETFNVLDEPHKTRAEKLYIKQYGVSPIQGVLPLTF